MKFMLGLFWALAVIGVLGIILVSSEPDHHTRSQDAKPAPSEQHATSSEEKFKEEQSETNGWAKYKKKIEDNEKVITAVSTLFIAAFTIILALATGFLYVATRDLVEGADNNAEKQLRAYVGLQNMQATVYPFEEGGFVVWAHTEARNFGQTPAYGMTIQSNTTVDVPTAIPFDGSQGDAKSAGAMTAFKDVGFQIDQTKRVTAEEVQAIRDQTKIIFFWGEIKYRDAFGKHHTFKFRLRSISLVVGTTNVWTMGAHSLGFEDED